jgi:hypothetical protein
MLPSLATHDYPKGRFTLGVEAIKSPNITKPKCSKYCADPEACQSCGRPRNLSRTTRAAPLPRTAVPAATVAPSTANLSAHPRWPPRCAPRWPAATLSRAHAAATLSHPHGMHQTIGLTMAMAIHGLTHPSMAFTHPSMRGRMPPSGSVSFQTCTYLPLMIVCNLLIQ